MLQQWNYGCAIPLKPSPTPENWYWTFLRFTPEDGNMENQEGWKRVAQALVNRRTQLGWPQRRQFAQQHGLKNDRVLYDLEHGRRDNYSTPTLFQIEQMNRWAPGSIQNILDGKDPIEISPVEIALANTLASAVASDLNPTLSDNRLVAAGTLQGLYAQRNEAQIEVNQLRHELNALQTRLSQAQGRLESVVKLVEVHENHLRVLEEQAGSPPADADKRFRKSLIDFYHNEEEVMGSE